MTPTVVAGVLAVVWGRVMVAPLSRPSPVDLPWKGLYYWALRVLTRPRAVWRVWRKLGLLTAVTLVRIRLGTHRKIYKVRVPQWAHPVYVRGGRSSDTMVLYEILVTDEYDCVGDLGSPGFIIDGGANIGIFSACLLNRYPAAHIVAVEPDAETMEVCRKNLAPYSTRAATFLGAIWSNRGSLCLEPGCQDWTTSVRSPGIGETGSIDALTIPSLIASNGRGTVDLLKLDVEGSEREIFGPDAQSWLPSVRNIVVELHGPDCEDRFFSSMAPYEYEMSNRDSVYVCRHIRPRAW